ncbi:MAG TPA: PDZ domain-containing protein, partial [Syntrophobacteraceae bacterium]|nr:PDZ domain-containing protein [Syntrophobacteraceae bacterium]
DLGIRVEELSPEAARQWGYEGIPGGLMISDVAAGSLAEDAGLQPGDVILEVNRKPVKTLSQYQKAIGEGSTKEGILFLIVRDQNSFYVLVKEG